MDLNLLSLLDPQSITSMNLGPSLLTDPADEIKKRMAQQSPSLDQVQTQAPVDAGAMAAPMNAQSVTPSMLQQLGQPTLDQLNAQQRPMQAPLMPGMPWMDKALNAMAPIPEAYKGMMSPQEQRRMQLQSLGQIGAGLTGALTPPGGQQYFGQNLARGMAAGQQGMEGALQPLNQALQTQMQGIGLQGLLQRQAMMQQAMGNGGTAGQPDPTDHAAMMNWYGQKATQLAVVDPQAAQVYRGLANTERMAQLTGRSSQAYAPADWNKQYGMKNPEPPAGTPAHGLWAQQGAEAALNEGYGGTAMRLMQISAQETRQGNFATTSGQAQQRIGIAQTGQANTAVKAFEGAPDVKPLLDQSTRFPVALGLLQKAAAGDKVAFGQVPMQMATIFDAKARMQMALLTKSGVLDSSLAGRINAALDRMASGTYPQDQIQNALKDMQDAQRQVMAAFDQKRTEYLNAHPEVRGKLRTTQGYFNTTPANGQVKLNTSATYQP